MTRPADQPLRPIVMQPSAGVPAAPMLVAMIVRQARQTAADRRRRTQRLQLVVDNRGERSTLSPTDC